MGQERMTAGTRPEPGVTAVVAQTKERAKLLARELGVDHRWVFGARSAATFEGLRAELVLIDADATIPDEFLSTIYGTVRKMPGGGGRIRFVTIRSELDRYRGVKVLGPFRTWLGHVNATGWYVDGDRLVITEAGKQIATYNKWSSVRYIRD